MRPLPDRRLAGEEGNDEDEHERRERTERLGQRGRQGEQSSGELDRAHQADVLADRRGSGDRRALGELEDEEADGQEQNEVVDPSSGLQQQPEDEVVDRDRQCRVQQVPEIPSTVLICWLRSSLVATYQM